MTNTSNDKQRAPLPRALPRIRCQLPDVRAYANARSIEELREYRHDLYFPKSDGQPHAWQDKLPAFYDELESRYPGVFIMRDGGDAPYQAHGFIGDYAFYLRSRHGKVQLRVFPMIDPTLTEEQLLEQGYDGYFYGPDSQGQTDQGYQSTTSVKEFWNGHDVDVWAQLIDSLEVAPFVYEFRTVKGDWDTYELIDENEPADTRWNWTFTQGLPNELTERTKPAHSPEEAYKKLCSSEHNRRYYQVDRVYAHPTPLNEDKRVFPDPLPDFSVIARTPLFSS